MTFTNLIVNTLFAREPFPAPTWAALYYFESYAGRHRH